MISELQKCPASLRSAIRELHNSSDRESRQQFLAEGPRVCLDMMRSGIVCLDLVIRDDADTVSIEAATMAISLGARVYRCGERDMQSMSTTPSPQSILMIAEFLPVAPLGPRVLVLDGVSDPGNVGTIIRSAVWFGLTDVLLTNTCADVYNSKVVRSTAGSLARVNIVRKQTVEQLMQNISNRHLIVSTARGGENPSVLHGQTEYCIVIGSEAHGVSEEIERVASQKITIPGAERTESLNAAVAAGVLMYETRL